MNLSTFFPALVVTGILLIASPAAVISQATQDEQTVPADRTENKIPEAQELGERNHNSYESESNREDHDDKINDHSPKKSRLKYRDLFECGC